MAPSDEPENNANICFQYEMWTKGVLNTKKIKVSNVWPLLPHLTFFHLVVSCGQPIYLLYIDVQKMTLRLIFTPIHLNRTNPKRLSSYRTCAAINLNVCKPADPTCLHAESMVIVSCGRHLLWLQAFLFYFIFLNRYREHDQLRLTTRKRRNWHLMFLRFVSFVLTEVIMRHFAI